MSAEEEIMVGRPRIDAFFPADRAESLNGKLYVMGGGFDALAVGPDKRALFWFGAILNIPWGDTNRRFTVAGRAHTEDHVELDWRLDGQLEVGRPPGRRAGDVIMPLAGPVGFEVAEAGRVIVTLRFDDDEKSFAIDVHEAIPPGMARPG